jgi:uncharacterized protein (DUF3084 family)
MPLDPLDLLLQRVHDLTQDVHRVAESLAEQRGKLEAGDQATAATLSRLQTDVSHLEKKLQDLELSLAGSDAAELSTRLSTLSQKVDDLNTAEQVRDGKAKLVKAALTLGGGATGAGLIEALIRLW